MASVNFLTAHDGFTLHDTVAYNDKHNEANGENNRDGHSHNLSYNLRVEGPTEDQGIRAVRVRQMRNMLSTLFFRRGTPMLLAGDEFAPHAERNNNAYCQDNEISWLDWDAIGEEEAGPRGVHTQRLIILRNALPILNRGRFLTGRYDGSSASNVTWLRPDGARWPRRTGATGGPRLRRAPRRPAQATGLHRKGGRPTACILLINAYHDLVTFNRRRRWAARPGRGSSTRTCPTARTRKASASRSPTR